MAYSAMMKKAVGQVRGALAEAGIRRQDSRFAEHGEHAPAADAPTVLVACSGGRDSMALAAVSHIVCAMLGVHCGAVIVDHRLQPGSGEVARLAAARCKGLGLDPVIVRVIDVKAIESGRSVEDAARQARYEAIVEAASDLHASAVLLAHTRDDQAETVLMDVLTRSAGIDALAGMPSAFVRGDIRFIRPFLDVTRAQTTAICRELGIEWWDDPTNGDAFETDEPLPQHYPLRSRVRHTLMPYLSGFFNGDVPAHLAQAARVASADRDFLELETDDLYRQAVRFKVDGAAAVMRVDALFEAHSAIRRRTIARVLARLDVPFSLRHVLSIEALVTDWHGQGAVSLPSGYSVNRQKHVIRVCKNGFYANCGCTGQD
ncbi:tRNA lysidine(34) synthetase TilS [Bifidobacterium sp. ESL0800]|uniref:tRNA lysidine(34) synthetase TilS n=1 Tax=Bifidobacterium sp. ESL0800 TaxID=2983236 RepID=UPI0023F7345B|nr:tRNA lysidine(34) synthetase TilS [Bifidobacterium sp. ESL0800]WEV75824.1 tRNA lysidine(34) synthetase TilS [Bifidobacterium sp. ESL0800]